MANILACAPFMSARLTIWINVRPTLLYASVIRHTIPSVHLIHMDSTDSYEVLKAGVSFDDDADAE